MYKFILKRTSIWFDDWEKDGVSKTKAPTIIIILFFSEEEKNEEERENEL